MRGFWRMRGFEFMRVFLLSSAMMFQPLLYSFEQTSGTKVDSKTFGGLSDDEVEQLAKQIQSEYNTAILKNIKKFNDGDQSSKFDGQNGGGGRYSGYGEAHITKGDGMISHEGGSNAMEAAVEKGALGQLGLSGDARVKKEQEIMNERTEKLQQPVVVNGKVYGYRNKLTGQMQTQNYEISAAMYDAGPAHGDADDPHRVYAIKPEVRKESENNARQYASKTIQDATLAPGKQPNLDLLHRAFSKMEQDKYIMMATDAFAFKSARLDETDTTDASTKNTIAEYKQMAVDIYADPKFAGNIKEAEKEIQAQLAKRVAEKKVINNKNLCWNGDVDNGKCPQEPNSGSSTPPAITADDAAKQILTQLGASTDGTNIEAIKKDIIGQFDVDPNTKQPKATSVKMSDLMKRVKLRSLSGVLNSQQLTAKYEQAKQGMKPEELGKIGQYQQRLQSNDCLSFTGFCYVKAFDASGQQQQQQQNQANNNPNAIDPNEFQKLSGDPGAHFKDTREFIYNKFAYAYTRPLAEWKGIVTNLDFSEDTDKNIKDVGLYKEFNTMYENAMKAANNTQQNSDKLLIDRLKSAGATPEQIAKIKPNYSVNFDPKKKTFMELFGQNKDRDAVMMDWRIKGSSAAVQYYNPYKRQVPTAPKAGSAFGSNRPNNTSPTLAGPN